MSANQVIEIFNALLTPTIAIVATYIAWQQWKVNKQKFDLDRYERRLRIYEEVRKILGMAVRDADVSYEDLLKFYTAVSEADFLFGPEITAYIEEIYNHGVQLEYLNKKYRSGQSTSISYDPDKGCNDIEKENKWFADQFKQNLVKEKFKKYLNIGR